MDIDISCDLPAINKLRFSAGLNCNIPLEDIEDIIREELHQGDVLVFKPGMDHVVKEEIARKDKHNESVYKNNTFEDVFYGRRGKSLQK